VHASCFVWACRWLNRSNSSGTRHEAHRRVPGDPVHEFGMSSPSHCIAPHRIALIDILLLVSLRRFRPWKHLEQLRKQHRDRK
jgi:hypothetical protein